MARLVWVHRETELVCDKSITNVLDSKQQINANI